MRAAIRLSAPRRSRGGRRFDPDQVHQNLHPNLRRLHPFGRTIEVGSMTKTTKTATPTPDLRGWKQIAEFMGLPVSTVQRWAAEGMPVARSGRNVIAKPEEVNAWLDRNTGQRQDVHIATEST